MTAVEFLLFLIPYFHVTAKEEVFLHCDFTPLKKGLDKWLKTTTNIKKEKDKPTFFDASPVTVHNYNM